jgi:hypothetical protein
MVLMDRTNIIMADTTHEDIGIGIVSTDCVPLEVCTVSEVCEYRIGSSLSTECYIYNYYGGKCMSSYPKVPKEQYDKALFHLRGELLDVLEPLRKYGQDPYVDGTIEQIIELAEKFSMVVRGKDIPIKINKRGHR